MKKQKIAVIVGVLTGVLVGFVFGAAYGTPDATLKTSGSGKGNVSELTKFRYGTGEAQVSDNSRGADTLTYTLTSADGQNWNITMTKK